MKWSPIYECICTYVSCIVQKIIMYLYIWLVVRYLLMFIHTNDILVQMISMVIEILHGSMWYMV